MSEHGPNMSNPDATAHHPIVIAVDTGGTFTDILCLRDATASRLKVPSTPADPAGTVIAAIRRGPGGAPGPTLAPGPGGGGWGGPPPPRPSARETALPCLPARVGELRGELRAGTFAVRP